MARDKSPATVDAFRTNVRFPEGSTTGLIWFPYCTYGKDCLMRDAFFWFLAGASAGGAN